MDRINIKCVLAHREVELQLDKKVMPGEVGPCFMITEGGCFKGYIVRHKNDLYKPLGSPYYSEEDLYQMSVHLKLLLAK